MIHLTSMIYLTSESYIKTNLDISDNISPKFLQSAMADAQTLKLRAILGDALTDRLEQLVDGGEIRQPQYAHYKELLDKYVQRYILWIVRKEIAHTTSYKISNFGVTRTNDEAISVATSEEIIADREFSQSKADAYAYRMQSWLLDNRTAFPELTDNACNMMRANLTSAASCGVWLGGVRGKINKKSRCTCKR